MLDLELDSVWSRLRSEVIFTEFRNEIGGAGSTRRVRRTYRGFSRSSSLRVRQVWTRTRQPQCDPSVVVTCSEVLQLYYKDERGRKSEDHHGEDDGSCTWLARRPPERCRVNGRPFLRWSMERALGISLPLVTLTYVLSLLTHSCKKPLMNVRQPTFAEASRYPSAAYDKPIHT
jgi:hypothetical protein